MIGKLAIYKDDFHIVIISKETPDKFFVRFFLDDGHYTTDYSKEYFRIL